MTEAYRGNVNMSPAAVDAEYRAIAAARVPHTIREKVELIVDGYLPVPNRPEARAELVALITTAAEAVFRTYDIERTKMRDYWVVSQFEI